MPSPSGFGLLAYIIFPVALAHWLTTPTYNVCESCAGRWQRGVHVTPTRVAADDRAGMYREQIPTAAVVRRRPRLGAPGPARDQRDVRVVASRGDCRTCRSADGQYTAANAPSLPIIGCTCPNGCTCVIEPIDDVSPKQADD